MKHVVMLTAEEWRRLIPDLAAYLEREARKPGGFLVVSKETGYEIDDRLGDWLCGVLSLGMSEWEKEHLETDQ